MGSSGLGTTFMKLIYIDCATEHMTEDIVLMLFLVYIIVIDGTETTFNATYDHKIVEVVDNIFS